MRRGLPLPFAWKVLLLTLAVAGAALLAFARIAHREAHLHLDRALGDSLAGHAAGIAALLTPSELDLIDEGEGGESAVVRRVRSRLDALRRGARLRDVIVLDAEGRTVVSLRPGAVRGEEHPFAALDPPEIAQAVAGRPAATALYRGVDGIWYKAGYAPVMAPGRPVTYIVGVEGEAAFFRALESFRRSLAFAAAGLLGALVLIAWLAARTVSGPVARLAEAARAAAAGDYGIAIAPASRDEVGALAAAVASLLEAVREREARLKESVTLAEARRARFESVGALAAAIAHEIRNPVGSMRGFAELLRRNPGNAAKVDDYAAEILAECRRVEALVGDFLQYARPAPCRPESVDAATLAGRVIFGLEAEAARRGVRVGTRIEGGLSVWADPEQLRQILHNLVRNAIEASPAGGAVDLEGASTPSGGARFTVTDDGPGIDEAVRPRLFEPFVTGRAEGTGLGLSIVARHVEAHRGSVEAGRAVGRGARFTVTLPAAPKGDS